MRRTIFLALLATLLLAPKALAASTTTILRDCEDDSVLQGHYSLSDLQKARGALVGDLSEYSDCRDVLGRAISAASAHTSSGANNGGGTGSGGGGGGTSSGGGSPSHSGSSSRGAETPQTTQDYVVGPSTPQDRAAVGEAAIHGAGPVDLGGHSVVPGARLATDLGRNSLPTALIVALALLAVAALAATAPLVRRRVVAHRQP